MHTNQPRPRRRPITALILGLTAIAFAAPAGAGAGPMEGGGGGGLLVALVDGAGAPTAGACFDVWTSAGQGNIEPVDQVRVGLCDSDAQLIVGTLPADDYVLVETSPPTLKLVEGGSNESHVYFPHDPVAFSTVFGTAELTLAHSIGAAIDVVSLLPAGGEVAGSCFEAREWGIAGPDNQGAGAVLDEACTSTGGPARLYVPGTGQVGLAQVTGPDGVAFAADQPAGAVADQISRVTMQMRVGRSLTIDQFGTDGNRVTGGCYAVAPTSGGVPVNACDGDGRMDGTVELYGLASLVYEVSEITPPDGFVAALPFTVDLNAQSVRRPVEHEPRAVPAVAIHVVDDRGTPVRGACVAITDPAVPETVLPYGCDGDADPADGLLTFRLAPGAYAIDVYEVPPGYVAPARHQAFTLGASDLDVTVTLAGGETNRAPVAAGDGATTPEDTPVVVDVLGNDTDPDGDALAVVDVAGAGHGTATAVDGTIRYTPAAHWSGSDAVVYTVADGAGGVDEAALTIEVVPVNDAPWTVDDRFTLQSGVATLLAVVTNDGDVEGDVLRPVIVTPPARGTAAVRPDGSVEYRSAAGFVGADTFTYRVTDGDATSAAVGTVHLEVRDPRGCTIVGTARNDVLVGTSGDDVICGLGGNDHIDGRGGRDTIYGDAGNDLLRGGAGDDRLDGGAGLNILSGDGGRDGWRNAVLALSSEYRW